MRYVRKIDKAQVRGLQSVGNIHVTGSVAGMQQRFGWPRGGQVRIGQFIYNVGVAEVERLRHNHILRGEQ